MNIRYSKLIGASIPLILLGGMLIGAMKSPVIDDLQKSDTVMSQIDESDVEIRIAAGVETVLARDYSEDIFGMILTEKDTTEVAEQEYSEYSDFAIANVTNYVNVRTEPNTDSEVVGKMYDNSVAQILSVVGEGGEEWYQVISGYVEGYIKSEYFIYGEEAAAVIDDYVTRYVVVKADRLNVREEPDIMASRIGYKDFGEKARLLEYGKEWSKILYASEKEGYVSSEYISIEEHFTYAKSIEEEQKELEAQRMLQQRALEEEGHQSTFL